MLNQMRIWALRHSITRITRITHIRHIRIGAIDQEYLAWAGAGASSTLPDGRD